MELGNQIKKYRSELQISQEQLADRIYVSRQTISNWENEKSYPDVNSLILLSEVFQTSIDKLIKGDIEIMKEKIKQLETTEEKEKQNNSSPENRHRYDRYLGDYRGGKWGGHVRHYFLCMAETAGCAKKPSYDRRHSQRL